MVERSTVTRRNRGREFRREASHAEMFVRQRCDQHSYTGPRHRRLVLHGGAFAFALVTRRMTMGERLAQRFAQSQMASVCRPQRQLRKELPVKEKILKLAGVRVVYAGSSERFNRLRTK
jgi:hypothetical protein